MENPYAPTTQLFYVHENELFINQMLLAAGTYATELHEEIPVYAHGWWEHDHQLWLDVQKANWDDVILDPEFKKRLQVWQRCCVCFFSFDSHRHPCNRMMSMGSSSQRRFTKTFRFRGR